MIRTRSSAMLYLDYNATTPCEEQVVAAMAPYFSRTFANPASRQHSPGREAFLALESARKNVASAIGASSATEVVFTSGATEANNLAIRGLFTGSRKQHAHIVSQRTEHPAVLEPLRRLQREGAELTLVDVDRDGRVDPDRVRAAMGESTLLVSIMLANNETGVVQDLREISRIAHQHGTLVHSDAAQAVGKIPVDVAELGLDLMSLSGHKVYGPKGIGALYIRRTSPPLHLAPLVDGGGHEGGLRSGTANVPGAVGLGRALELAAAALDAEAERLRTMRDAFEARLMELLPELIVNGQPAPRLPGTSNVAFPGVDGEALMASLQDLAVSSGSACASAHPEPSTVLRAMGLPKRVASSALRISFGRPSRDDDAEHAAERIASEVSRLRKRSSAG